MSKLAVGSLVALASLFIAAPAVAQPWFVGIEAGSAHVEFRPTYESPEDSELTEYVDRARGFGAGLFGGRQWRRGTVLELAVQARVALNSAQWELAFTDFEHSTMKYDQQARVMLSAVPAWRVAGRLWLTGEVGGGTARVREVKVSTDYTQYAFNRWVGAYVIGAGVRVDVAAHVKAFAAYRYERTNQFTYDSFLPNGLQWETITDRPRMQGVTAGIAYHF